MKWLYCFMFGHKIDKEYYRPILKDPSLSWHVKCTNCGKINTLSKWARKIRWD